MRRVQFNHPHSGRPISLGWLPLVLTVLTLPAAASEAVRLADVERAILQADDGQGTLKEKWKPVVRLLKDVDEQTADPVLRIIKGHACLATNRNNEAVCLFLSVQTPEDKNRWLDWTRGFAAKHPRAAIASCLKGDALGRLGHWDEAIACFTLAIDQAPDKEHALAFNARGVAYASRNEFRKARADFDLALASSAHALADAYANIGALCLQRKDGASGGLTAFDAALQLSPCFALALHGRGCVKTILSEFESAARDLEAARQHAGCLAARELLIANGLRYQAYWRGMTGQQLLASLSAGEEAGTTFDARVAAAVSKAEAAWSDYTSRAGRIGGQGAFNNYFEAYGQLQRISPGAAENFFRGTVQPDILSNPRIAHGHDDGLNAIARTNALGGGGELTDMALSPSPNHQVHFEYATGFIDAFEEVPFVAAPADRERVHFRGLMIPKRVRVTTSIEDSSEVLTFSDQAPIAGYVPQNEQASRYRLAALLTNTGLQLVDKNGNETVFDPNWNFQALVPSRQRGRIIRSVSAGGQRVTFRYLLDPSGKVVIASATVAENQPHAQAVHMVHYEHDDEGRLCRVTHGERGFASHRDETGGTRTRS